jgi:hypothetical protein
MRCVFAIALAGVLGLSSFASSEETPAAKPPLPGGAVATEGAKVPPPEDVRGQMVMRPLDRDPDFKPYIFWAYGLACLIIFLFILWTLSQLRRVEEKVEHLARTQAERRSGQG